MENARLLPLALAVWGGRVAQPAPGWAVGRWQESGGTGLRQASASAAGPLLWGGGWTWVEQGGKGLLGLFCSTELSSDSWAPSDPS